MMTFLLVADVYVDGERVARASYDLDQHRLWSEVEWTSRMATRLRRPSECDHDGRVEAGFVFVEWPLQKHWPIRFCSACLTITAGASSLAWKDDPADPVALAWNKEWPKSGKPRRSRPPEDTPWEAVS